MATESVFDLSGRSFLVTGGSSGIGLGMATGLVRAGASVCIAARDETRNERAVEVLSDLGGRAISVACDVSDEGSVVAAVGSAIDAFGSLDGAIAAAGTQPASHPIHKYPLEDWRAAMATNLEGTMVTVREVASHLVERGRPGSIVVVGSITDRYGQERLAPYAAAKAAVVSLVRTAAVELARHSVRVNAVLPGWIDTPMLRPLIDADAGTLAAKARDAVTARTPMRRWGSPDEFAGVAVYLLGPTSSFHTGDVITIDGGYSVF